MYDRSLILREKKKKGENSLSKTIRSINDLLDNLLDTFKINQIPSSRANRLDLERHYGRCEIIQYIIDTCEIRQQDVKDNSKVSPLDYERDPRDYQQDTPQDDPIESLLMDKGYLSE